MNPVPFRYGTAVYGVARYTRAFNPGGRHMIHQLRVLLGFSSAGDHQLEELAGSVIQKMTGNPAYLTPPVTLIAVQAALTAFTAAIAAQQHGGTAATADKNNKRDALIELLRQLAGYVQANCNNDLATLLTSGFDAVSSGNAQQPLAAPVIQNLDNGISGQLVARVKPVANARTYEIRYAALGAGGTPGPWLSGGMCTNSRAIPINGLTPGTIYVGEIRAIGGSTGFSDWSNAVSHMSM